MGAVLGTALTFCGAALVMRPAAKVTPQALDAGTVPPAAGGPASHSPAAGAGSPPVHLEIPALRVRARVRPVDVRPDGTLEVPPSARDLGWWRGGAAPGSATGTVVVAGHVDTAKEGPGALFELRGVRMGSQVNVRSTDGRTRNYRIVARRAYPKQRLPASVFAPDAPARLVLITCTGAFDRRAASYSHNLVVYAKAD
ncbi:class F sortase [Actinomadura sp. NPDC047616]|uniref:class F sortase n=1 Tax=Actinomadura sp. NPDC047616 TaxID=3155914 RepID=UPI003405C5E6